MKALNRLLLPVLLACIVPSFATADVAYVGGTQSQNIGSGQTIAFNNTASTNAYLFVMVDHNDSGGSAPGTTVTYNGVSLTLLKASTDGVYDGSNGRLEVWGLASPATGTHNVVVNFSFGTSPSVLVASYNGIGSIGEALESHATSVADGSLSVVTNASNASSVYLQAGGGAGSWTAGSGQTFREDTPSGFPYVTLFDSVPGTGSVTLTLNFTGVFTKSSFAAIELVPFATTPTFTPTVTNTRTPTATPTWSPTITPTATPSASPTVTPTVTPSATRTPTPTATPTVTITQTFTVTRTSSRTATGSPTRTSTRTPVATKTPSPTISATPTPVFTGTVTLTPVRLTPRPTWRPHPVYVWATPTPVP